MTNPKSSVVSSILPDDAESGVQQLAATPERCSRVEIRADRITVAELSEMTSSFQSGWIVTVRRPSEGGLFTGSEEERADLLSAGLKAGAGLADVELDSGMDDRLRRKGVSPERLLLSWHGGRSNHADLEDLLRRMRNVPAAAYKIVPLAGELSDLVAIRSLLAGVSPADLPVTCFATGRAGVTSRILGPSWGSATTYGTGPGSGTTADGQIDADLLLELYDVDGITNHTRLFGLLGSNLALSPSPAMHCSAMAKAGLDGRYLPLETDRFEDLAILSDPAGPFRFEGFGVTLPFTGSAASFVASRDRAATLASSVNTVVQSNGRWHGLNTDASAMQRLLEETGGCKGMTVHIVGAGGTARTAGAVFGQSGGRICFFTRTPDSGRQAAEASGGEWKHFEEIGAERPEILVNGTPLGTAGEDWLPEAAFPSRMVLDAVYGRGNTALVKKARKAGTKLISGQDLMLEQAADQFAALTTTVAPKGDMLRAMDRWFQRIARTTP
jgi:3-dehydroquinate dehydratase/shikimate dehydrogenase